MNHSLHKASVENLQDNCDTCPGAGLASCSTCYNIDPNNTPDADKCGGANKNGACIEPCCTCNNEYCMGACIFSGQCYLDCMNERFAKDANYGYLCSDFLSQPYAAKQHRSVGTFEPVSSPDPESECVGDNPVDH